MQEVYPEVQVRIPFLSLIDPCFCRPGGRSSRKCWISRQPKIVKFP